MRFPQALLLTCCVLSAPVAWSAGGSAQTPAADSLAASAAAGAAGGAAGGPVGAAAARRTTVPRVAPDRLAQPRLAAARSPVSRAQAARPPVAGAPMAGTLLATTAVASATRAAAPGELAPGAQTAWRAVDASALDAARGGFQLPSGLAVGLGIERTVSLNGELVTQTRFAIADVRAMTAEQAAMARDAMSSMQLVQNGRVASQGPPASALAGAALPAGLGATIVQNSLDNQRIQSQTVIDASVNSLDGYKALNFSSSVLDALAHAATGR